MWYSMTQDRNKPPMGAGAKTIDNLPPRGRRVTPPVSAAGHSYIPRLPESGESCHEWIPAGSGVAVAFAMAEFPPAMKNRHDVVCRLDFRNTPRGEPRNEPLKLKRS